jgi:hypothetical protein
VVLFLTFLAALKMSAHPVPVGVDARGRSILIMHRPLGFCLVVAIVVAGLATILLCQP